ncbi:MAG: polysaccharide deacetylase family protein [Oscillospiraceae bacterium]|nr:polysaccharide deacetylase family protein [Oscillospiraceae bacterium]
MKRIYVFITIRRALWRVAAALAIVCALLIVAGVVTARTRNTVAADASKASVRLPIIMYHSVVPDGVRGKNDYQITETQFSRDLDYLAARGYNTVVIADLIRYADGESLADNPVMLTFDDGHLNNLTIALPQMEQRGMRGVFSVCGVFIERAERECDPSPAYSYMTWDDVREAASSGVVEIQNHSYNLHGDKGRKGFTRRSGETMAAFQSSLIEDVSKMQQLLRLNAGVEAACFTYPYGFLYQDSWEMLRDLGFQAAMTCRERVNYLPQNPEALYHLDRFNRSGLTSTEGFMKRLGIE